MPHSIQTIFTQYFFIAQSLLHKYSNPKSELIFLKKLFFFMIINTKKNQFLQYLPYES